MLVDIECRLCRYRVCRYIRCVIQGLKGVDRMDIMCVDIYTGCKVCRYITYVYRV